MKIRRLVLGGILTGLAGLAQAATIVVTTHLDTVDDDGLCSLREAMLNAENADQSGSSDCAAGSPDGNLIVFASGSAGERIVLNLGPLPTITRNLDIQGPVPGDPEGIIISAGGQSRILDINGVDLKVTLDSLSLVEGRTSASGESGAAIRIRNNADVTLQNMRLHENQVGGPASDGGAIDIEEASLTVNESELSANFSAGRGGAINANNSQIFVDSSVITANASTGSGGFIHAQGGSLQVSSSTISNNETQGVSASGGGLSVTGGTVLLSQTEVDGNRTLGAFAQGGAMAVGEQGSALTLMNTSVRSNYTLGFASSGGGIHAWGNVLTITGGEVGLNRTEGSDAGGGGINARNASISGGTQIKGNWTEGEASPGGGALFSNGIVNLDSVIFEDNETLGANAHGGAIFFGAVSTFPDSAMALSSVTVRNNRTLGQDALGGGIYVNSGPVTMTGGHVENNRTVGAEAHGGGIYVNEADIQLSAGVRLRRNETEGDDARGGGVAVFSGNIEIYESIVEDNITAGAEAHGGAIFVEEGSLVLSQVEITENETLGPSAHGGGLYLTDTEATVGDCRFVRNKTNGNEAYGGGIHLNGGTFSLEYCYLDSNSAQSDDAAGGALFGANADLSIDNTTFYAGNAERGGAMYLLNSSLQMSQSSFAYNEMNSGSKESALLEIHGDQSDTFLFNTVFTENDLPTDGAVIRLQGFASLQHVTIANAEGSHAIKVHGTPAWQLRNSVIVHSGTGPACSHASSNPSGSLATDASCGAMEHDENEIGLESIEELTPVIPSLEPFVVFYHPIRADGLARNAGGDCADLQIYVDQIGQARPGGGSPFCDAGAYESQAPATIELSVDPAALQFGSVPVGEKGETQLLTLTNTGQAAVEISAISVAGSNPGDFPRGRGDDGCIGPLLPSESCILPIFFQPTEAGVRTATIQIYSNASGSPQSVSLSGTGTPKEPGEDRIFSDRFQSNGQ